MIPVDNAATDDDTEDPAQDRAAAVAGALTGAATVLAVRTLAAIRIDRNRGGARNRRGCRIGRSLGCR